MVHGGAFTASWNARIWNGHDSEYVGTVRGYPDLTLHNMRDFTHRLQARCSRKTAQESAA